MLLKSALLDLQHTQGSDFVPKVNVGILLGGIAIIVDRHAAGSTVFGSRADRSSIRERHDTSRCTNAIVGHTPEKVVGPACTDGGIEIFRDGPAASRCGSRDLNGRRVRLEDAPDEGHVVTVRRSGPNARRTRPTS